MPREQLSIRTFNKGMTPAVDTSDMDPQSPFWCQDVDLLSSEGRLIGLPADENKSTSIAAIGNAQGHGWIEKTDGKRTLAYYDREVGDLLYVEDFFGTPSSIGSIYDGTANACNRYIFIPRHGTLRLNAITAAGVRTTPWWLGYTTNSIFGYSNSALITRVAECTNPSSASNGHFYVNAVSGTPGTASYFARSKNYYYRIALEYDGYQISVLDSKALALLTNYFNTGSGGDYASLNVTIRAHGGATTPSDFNLRVTAVLLFRAESANDLTVPTTAFRLVERIAISDTDWATAATDHKDIIIVDTGSEGAEFEVYSGLAETATFSMLDWAIACQADNYMFIGNCYHANLPDAPYMIFRSVAGRYDVFDFQSAAPPLLRLPEKPVAMGFYFGRLLVFDNNNMYRINVESMEIEEIIAGYGCLSPQSLVSTQHGLFFANAYGVYLYDGRAIKKISGPIQEFTETPAYDYTGTDLVTINNDSYRVIGAAATDANPIRLAYHPRFDMLLIGGSVSSATIVYGYVIGRDAWTLLSVPTATAGAKFSFISAYNGDVYLAYRSGTSNFLYKYISNFSSLRNWTWISHNLNFNEGDRNQYQKVYYLYTGGGGTLKVFYGYNNGTMQYVPSSGAINASYVRNTSFRFILASGAAGAYINNANIIFRRMIGRR